MEALAEKAEKPVKKAVKKVAKKAEEVVDTVEALAEMAEEPTKKAVEMVTEKAEEVVAAEKKTDKYEDKLGTYLVKISAHELTDRDSMETSVLLHVIGDLERLSDHAVNVLESAEEINEKKLEFSDECKQELGQMIGAVKELSLIHI